MSINMTNEKGNIAINENVIAKIAGIAALECPNVVGMAVRTIKDGKIHILKNESIAKGIDVKTGKDNTVDIKMHIIIRDGVNVRDTGEVVLEHTKSVLETALEQEINSIKIAVEGISSGSCDEKRNTECNITGNSVSEILGETGIKSNSIGLVKKEGIEYIGKIGNNEICADKSINRAAKKIIDVMLDLIGNGAIIAIYYKEHLTDEAKKISELIKEEYSDIDVELHKCNESEYDYIIGVE